MYVGLGNLNIVGMIEEKARARNELDCLVSSEAFTSSSFGYMLVFGGRPRFPSLLGKFGQMTVDNGLQDSTD